MTTRKFIGLTMVTAPIITWVLLLGFSGHWDEALILACIVLGFSLAVTYIATMLYCLFYDDE